MAKYTTTTEELTSIANAIRTAGGTSSQLIYPTGFVSAINQLGVPVVSTYNALGEDMEFVQTLFTQHLTLDDTNFSSWTPTTSSAGTIVPQTNGTAYTPTTSNQQFMLLNKVKIIYNYATEVENKAKILECYFTGVSFVTKNYTGVQNFIEGSRTYYASIAGTSFQEQIYYGSNGVYGITGNSYGFYVTNTTPSLSNQASSTPTITPKTPLIRAIAHNSYITVANFQALDTTNTTIDISIDLYATDANKVTLGSKVLDSLHEMYAAQHTTT